MLFLCLIACIQAACLLAEPGCAMAGLLTLAHGAVHGAAGGATVPAVRRGLARGAPSAPCPPLKVGGHGERKPQNPPVRTPPDGAGHGAPDGAGGWRAAASQGYKPPRPRRPLEPPPRDRRPVTAAHRLYRLGLLMVTAGTVFWSAAGYFTRLIQAGTWTMVFWRGVFGVLTALVVLAVQKRGRIIAPFIALGGPGVLFTLASALGMLAFLGAMRLTTVAHVGIIYAALPFVAALMAWVVLRERSGPATLAASAVAFAGVGLTVFNGLHEGNPLGDVLAVVMTLLMGVMIVIARRSRGIPMIPAAGGAALIATLIALPLASPWDVTAPDLLYLALFGISNMGLGLILVTAGSKLIPAVETALIGSLEAPLAPLWVWLAFGETPIATTLIGGALVMAAVVGHVVVAARRPPPPDLRPL